MSSSGSEHGPQTGTWGGMGRWIAVASELPCAVIALLFAGQIVGQAIWGPSGATWGAIIGSFVGFGIRKVTSLNKSLQPTAKGGC